MCHISFTARGMELFLEKLVDGSSQVAQQHNAKALRPAHLYVHSTQHSTAFTLYRKHYVHSEPLMDFVKDVVESAPEIGQEGDSPKLKRQRYT